MFTSPPRFLQGGLFGWMTPKTSDTPPAQIGAAEERRLAQEAADREKIAKEAAKRKAADAAAAAARGVGGSFWVPRVTEQQVRNPDCPSG